MRQFIVSCEHGGNEIPLEYKDLFEGATDLLQSHRGWDPGALPLAKEISKEGKFPFFYETTSRLLIELNRSLHHSSLFSNFTNHLSSEEKKQIINQFYLPYREKVAYKINELINQKNTVIHLSIHSFTPVLNGVERNCDIGLLYDPKRTSEKEFCQHWKAALEEIGNNWKVRMNYPYKGTADGFTTYLRKKFPKNYSGIELEVNQAMFQNDKADTINKIVESLKTLI